MWEEGVSGSKCCVWVLTQNNFERAATDVFSFSAPNCGTMKRIVIGHDNSGPGAAWHLNKVRAPWRLPAGCAVTQPLL